MFLFHRRYFIADACIPVYLSTDLLRMIWLGVIRVFDAVVIYFLMVLNVPCASGSEFVNFPVTAIGTVFSAM